MFLHTNPWSSSALQNSFVTGREVLYSLLNFRIEFIHFPLKVLLLSKIIFHNQTLTQQSSFINVLYLIARVLWDDLLLKHHQVWKLLEGAWKQLSPFPGDSNHCTTTCSPIAVPQGLTAPQYFASRELEGHCM